MRRRLVRAGVGIAAVAVAALVVAQVTLLHRLDQARYMLSRGRELLEFIASPDVTTVPLVATELAPDARAFLAHDRRSGRVVLFAFDLPPAPHGKAYQLWAIAEGVRPGVVFSPDARGGAVLQADWSPGRRDAPLFAVTLEPSGGEPEPTGQIFLLGAPSRTR